MAHYRLELADGQRALAKVASSAAASPGAAGPGFGAEASGLRWLAAAAAVPVPDVLGWDDHALIISWITPEVPDRRSAVRFGRELARLHAAGSAGFGAPWPGFIAGLPLPNGPGPGAARVMAASGADGGPSWGEWYAGARLLPDVRLGRDRGALSAGDAAVVEAAAARAAAVAGPAEPPSRIHGDCWSGNVLWSGGRGWLVGPRRTAATGRATWPCWEAASLIGPGVFPGRFLRPRRG